MSQLPAVVPGTRQHSHSLAGHHAAKAGGNRTGMEDAGGAQPMQRSTQDVVALSKNGLDLSAKGLAQRSDALGNATVDAAQDFLKNITHKMFGDGASISFDSADLQADSHFSGAAASVSGAKGSSQAAAFSLAENAHFIGKGKITTADGQSFDFEVEVQYQSNISASALQQTSNQTADAPDAGKSDNAGLPARQLPATDFAGNLNDLFKLLGQQLQSGVFTQQHGNTDASASSKDSGQAGSLKLRLVNLVHHPKKTEAHHAEAKPDAKSDAQARALATAYAADDKPAAPALAQA